MAWSQWQAVLSSQVPQALTMLDIAVIGRGPMFPWSHLGFIVVILGCYLGVCECKPEACEASTLTMPHNTVYIHLANTGIYVYEFLSVEWQEGSVSGVVLCIIGIGLGGMVSLLISDLLVFLRELIAARVQKSGGWGTACPAGVSDSELVPTTFGPGPEGEGGRRDALVSGHECWRQRWPVESSGKGEVRGEYELQPNGSNA